MYNEFKENVLFSILSLFIIYITYIILTYILTQKSLCFLEFFLNISVSKYKLASIDEVTVCKLPCSYYLYLEYFLSVF